MAKSQGSPQGIINEPLRLVLSPKEQAFILARIAKAKRQLVYSVTLYHLLFRYFICHACDGHRPLADTLVMIYLLGSLLCFGTTLYFFLSGTLDWIMFARRATAAFSIDIIAFEQHGPSGREAPPFA